jgi:hypothetical protein
MPIFDKTILLVQYKFIIPRDTFMIPPMCIVWIRMEKRTTCAKNGYKYEKTLFHNKLMLIFLIKNLAYRVGRQG